MGIIKVLKRKDGASLVVGVSLALILTNFVTNITGQLGQKITELGSNAPAATQPLDGWRINYLSPIASFILQVLALEIVVWVYVWLHGTLADSKK